jgi:hypothetical protein
MASLHYFGPSFDIEQFMRQQTCLFIHDAIGG